MVKCGSKQSKRVCNADTAFAGVMSSVSNETSRHQSCPGRQFPSPTSHDAQLVAGCRGCCLHPVPCIAFSRAVSPLQTMLTCHFTPVKNALESGYEEMTSALSVCIHSSLPHVRTPILSLSFGLHHRYEKLKQPGAPAPLRASSNLCTKLDAEPRSTNVP